MLSLSSPFVAGTSAAPLPWAKLVTAGTLTPAFSMNSSVSYTQNSDVLFRLPDGNFILFGDTAARISTPAAVLGASTVILSGATISRVIQSKKNGYTFLVIGSDGKARYVTAKGDRTITVGGVLYSNVLTDLMATSFGVNAIAAAWDEDAGQLVLAQVKLGTATVVASLYTLNTAMALVSTASRSALTDGTKFTAITQAKAILQANGQILASFTCNSNYGGGGSDAIIAAKITKTTFTGAVNDAKLVINGYSGFDNHAAVLLLDDFGTALQCVSNGSYPPAAFFANSSNALVVVPSGVNTATTPNMAYPNLLRGDVLNAILWIDGSNSLNVAVNGTLFNVLTNAYATGNRLIDAVPTADGQGFATVDLGGGIVNLSFVGHG